MIQLSRDREKHDIAGKQKYLIPGGLWGHHLRNKNRLLLEHKRSKGQFASDDFKTHYWKPAKAALRTETHNKCAYCEAPVKVVAHGDVEHYRPKSKYWWLSYCYDNYLYACQVCNQIHKHDHFPIQGSSLAGPDINGQSVDEVLDDWQARLCPDPIKPKEGHSLAQHIADHLAERPLLLNPYFDEPEKYIAYQVIPVLEEVRVVAVQNDGFAAQAVDAMEQYYGLNREELVRRRYLWYLAMETLGIDLQKPDLAPAELAEKKAKLKRFLEPDCEYAGMTRYFVREVWKLELD